MLALSCLLLVAASADDGVRVGALVVTGAGQHRPAREGQPTRGGAHLVGGVFLTWVVEGLELGIETSFGQLDTEIEGIDWALSALVGGVIELGPAWRYHPRLSVGGGSLPDLPPVSVALTRPVERTGAIHTRLEALAFSWAQGDLRFRAALPAVNLSVSTSGSTRRASYDWGLGLLLGVELIP